MMPRVDPKNPGGLGWLSQSVKRMSAAMPITRRTTDLALRRQDRVAVVEVAIAPS